MGQSMRGIYQEVSGLWEVDKWKFGTRFRQRGFRSFDEAERWLIGQLAAQREVVVHGQRPAHTFNQAAANYIRLNGEKISLETEIYMLKSVMPFIGELGLHEVHDDSLKEYRDARLAEGRAHKTINLALGVVRLILNLAATTWRDEQNQKWLEHAPKITMLPLDGHQREPRPITWNEQKTLLQQLAGHLARMSLFALNTGVRDDVICSLKWEWEIRIPQLGISVFEVPPRHVKGRKGSKFLICNSVAQAIIESVRGQHLEYVFVYRRERVKNLAEPPKMSYRPIATMNNTAWQSARMAAGLDDLHVHDLRHTVGMRLREAGVLENTISDILWHKKTTTTQHYSVAQVMELHAALEKIKDNTGQWNKSLATLKRERLEATSAPNPPKVPQQEKAQK